MTSRHRDPLRAEQEALIEATARRHRCLTGYCPEPYPFVFREWPASVKRSAAALFWLRRHGHIGLAFISAVVTRMARVEKRGPS